jgi:hypothetical protein
MRNYIENEKAFIILLLYYYNIKGCITLKYTNLLEMSPYVSLAVKKMRSIRILDEIKD